MAKSNDEARDLGNLQSLVTALAPNAAIHAAVVHELSWRRRTYWYHSPRQSLIPRLATAERCSGDDTLDRPSIEALVVRRGGDRGRLGPMQLIHGCIVHYSIPAARWYSRRDHSSSTNCDSIILVLSHSDPNVPCTVSQASSGPLCTPKRLGRAVQVAPLLGFPTPEIGGFPLKTDSVSA